MTQTLLDVTDLTIVASFIAATLTLVIYVWRAERHRPTRYYDIVDFR